MQEDVFIHQTSDQKVCNIEKHYELAIIEYNPVKITNVAVEKFTSSLAKEDASNMKKKCLTNDKTSDKRKLLGIERKSPDRGK
jgi:hypothetical protein